MYFTHLHIPSPPIQIHMQILDLAKLAKELLYILLAGLFVYIRHHDDPALYAADRDRAGRGAGFVRARGGFLIAVAGGGGGGVVDVHLFGSHGVEEDGRGLGGQVWVGGWMEIVEVVVLKVLFAMFLQAEDEFLNAVGAGQLYPSHIP